MNRSQDKERTWVAGKHGRRVRRGKIEITELTNDFCTYFTSDVRLCFYLFNKLLSFHIHRIHKTRFSLFLIYFLSQSQTESCLMKNIIFRYPVKHSTHTNITDFLSLPKQWYTLSFHTLRLDSMKVCPIETCLNKYSVEQLGVISGNP